MFPAYSSHVCFLVTAAIHDIEGKKKFGEKTLKDTKDIMISSVPDIFPDEVPRAEARILGCIIQFKAKNPDDTDEIELINEHREAAILVSSL